ncbi:MAG: AAA family ATPase [Pseudomonadota bacterium]
MSDQRELGLLLRGRIPLIAIDSRNEKGILDLLIERTVGNSRGQYIPLFRWSVTDGLQRLDIALEPQPLNSQPTDVLAHIRAITKPGYYVLIDFHPYLKDPLHVRKIKDICLAFEDNGGKLILLSPGLQLPEELRHFSVQFEMRFPDEAQRTAIVQEAARQWRERSGRNVTSDRRAIQMLVRNLAGLCQTDVHRLAYNAIADDGVIDCSDVRGVMQAKYELLNRDGVLTFEYDTAQFSSVAGLRRLKHWLSARRAAFMASEPPPGLDQPKGVLLLGVQGCGKSLAAKATAGALGTPLLRLEFGALFNKYHGETERNLRESLKLAGTMAPCVLWIDELEKGLSGGNDTTGTSQRVLGAFLTWMAERQPGVFVVATANDITALPPELVRKGRFDEIFFVDLPAEDVREDILKIHLRRRNANSDDIDTARVAAATSGFSGAELEQLVVSAFYAAHAEDKQPTTAHLLQEAELTSPLSVVMEEQISELRRWANGRTVVAD